MSFTFETKQELLHLQKSETCCAIAELSALMAVNGQLSLSSEGMRLQFQTSNLALARHVIRSLKRLYDDIEVEVVTKKGVRLKKQNQYITILKRPVTKVVRELGLMDETTGYAQRIDDAILNRECCRRAYLRGAFLASGSLNHPRSSSYHLEMTVDHAGFADDLVELLSSFSLTAKTIRRKQRSLVYIKDSEHIADFLRLIGANQALLNFEDERIKRDFVNSITRVMNMEIANQNKTFEAAERQLKNIEIVERLDDPERLSESLKEAIFLRKHYPDASLSELSEQSERHFNKRISKSALNHRFRNLAQRAAEALEAYYDA